MPDDLLLVVPAFIGAVYFGGLLLVGVSRLLSAHRAIVATEYGISFRMIWSHRRLDWGQVIDISDRGSRIQIEFRKGQGRGRWAWPKWRYTPELQAVYQAWVQQIFW